jgi:hypothetical protein
MKSLIVFAAALVSASAILAAEKDDVKGAAEKLAGSDNYSWTSTMESPQFSPPPSQGKAQKDGLVSLEVSMQDNKVESFAKDGKGAIKTEDGWLSLDEAAKAEGGDGGFNFSRFMAMRLRNFKAPAVQAGELADQTKSLAKDGDAYSGELTEEGAKGLMTMGGRRGGQGQPPPISNAKGTVKFWVKDGVLTKYVTKVTGTMKNRDGDDMDIDRTTTIEIKEVGTTKINVPDDAKKKMT